MPKTIDYLKHHSRPLIFSASMSPANAAAVLAALQIMLQEPERIAQLWRNTHRMKQGLRDLGFNLGRLGNAHSAGVLPGSDGGLQDVQAVAGGGPVRQPRRLPRGGARTGTDPHQPDGDAHGQAG